VAAPRENVPPLPNTYWVVPGRLLAGEYPASHSRADSMERLRRLLGAGVTYFIDLTEPGELAPYDTMLPTGKGASGRYVMYARKPIRDHSVPEAPELMAEILEYVERALEQGHIVYVHCRAGIGRTGTVMGCYLSQALAREAAGQRSAQMGLSAAAGRGAAGKGAGNEEALALLNTLWRANDRALMWPQTPETEEQQEYVLSWRARMPAPHRESAPAVEMEVPALDAARTLRDRFHGAMLGLAVGDALGCAAQHRKPGSFTPLGDLLGGGPFDLPRGAWSDDTAMALCLAESLLECDGPDPADQVRRYQWWQREGHLSSTGQCIGITATVSRALATAQWSGKPLAGSHDPARQDKEPLSRVAPAVLFHLADPVEAAEQAADAARTTHQSPIILDACRYFAALLAGALRGASRVQLLAPGYGPLPGFWERRGLKPAVAAIAAGSFREKEPPDIEGGGTILHTLEAVLWAINRSSNFRDGALLAVNLGLDADVTGAVYGQLAGALYGVAGIPSGWRGALYERTRVEEFADRLLAVAMERMAS